MWGMVAIAAISAASSIYGAARKSRIARHNARRQRAALVRKEQENEAWYRRRVNEDLLERTENRALLEAARQQLMRSSAAHAGNKAVTGASNAASAAQKAADNEAYTGLVAGIASNASRTRDEIERQYMKNKDAITDQQLAAEQARAEAQGAAIDTAVAGVQGAASVAGAAAAKTGSLPGSGVGKTGSIVKPSQQSNLNMARMQGYTQAQMDAARMNGQAATPAIVNNPGKEYKDIDYATALGFNQKWTR